MLDGLACTIGETSSQHPAIAAMVTSDMHSNNAQHDPALSTLTWSRGSTGSFMPPPRAGTPPTLPRILCCMSGCSGRGGWNKACKCSSQSGSGVVISVGSSLLEYYRPNGLRLSQTGRQASRGHRPTLRASIPIVCLSVCSSSPRLLLQLKLAQFRVHPLRLVL